MFHYVLCHPEVQFKVILNQNLLLNSLRNSTIQQNFDSIFGAQENMIMFSNQTIDFKLDAYLSSQNGGVSNANIQKLFVIVNRRPIVNEDLYKAIKTAFKVKSALRQPIGVVYIQVPLGTIDFNVSADKTVARIQNESRLIQFISESYSQELDRETKERLTQQS